LENYVAPEITVYAEQIIKNTIGTKTKIKSFEWSTGGLFNKVFCINTTDGDFVLKIECDKIFFATRKDQIENEVAGNQIFQKAGVACPNILAYDFNKNNIGIRYVLMERVTNDCLWNGLDQFDEETKSEIIRQINIIIEKEKNITNTHFGNLSPSGTLGWHETYDGYYHSTLNLLINDCIKYNLFTDEELDIVKKAAQKPLVYSKKYIPAFDHGDLGYHNLIWGSINNKENKLYVIDFGNAAFGLPYCTEIYGIRKEGVDMIDVMGLDRNLYENNLIGDFGSILWTASQKLTEDYKSSRMEEWIEDVKKDTSRKYIADFVDKCRNKLE